METPVTMKILHTVLDLSSMAFTNAEDSLVHERTVSVLPSLYILVIEASYVRQNFPASCKVQHRVANDILKMNIKLTI